MSTPPDPGPWATAQPPSAQATWPTTTGRQPAWPTATGQRATWSPPGQHPAWPDQARQPGWPSPGQPAPWAPRQPEPPVAAKQPARVPVSTFVVSLLCAVVVAGLIGVFTAGGFHSRSAGSATAPPAPAVNVDGQALRALIVRPPAGTREVSFDVGDNGVFDLDQFVRNYFNDSNATETDLRSMNFRWMAQRGWVGPDGIQIDDQLVEFDTASHAQQFVLKQERAYARDTRYTSTFQVPGGGTGYERSQFDPAGIYRASVLGSRDNVAVVLLVYAPGDFNRAEESQVLDAQMAALP